MTHFVVQNLGSAFQWVIRDVARNTHVKAYGTPYAKIFGSCAEAEHAVPYVARVDGEAVI